WYRLCHAAVDRLDTESMAFIDHLPDCKKAVSVELRFRNADKGPARTHKLSLAGHIVVISFGTMPCIAVAFDGQSRVKPLDDKINAIARDFVLSTHPVLSPEQFQCHIDLEPTFIGVGLAACFPGQTLTRALEAIDLFVEFLSSFLAVKEIQKVAS